MGLKGVISVGLKKDMGGRAGEDDEGKTAVCRAGFDGDIRVRRRGRSR